MDTSSDYDHRENETKEEVDAITFGFNQKLDLEDAHEQVDHEEHDDDDFTFILVGEDDQPIDTDKAFEDGQIFPLFDQKLLNDHYDIEEINHLPMHPPVDKVFIQSPRGFPPSTSARHDEDSAAGPYCAWSKDTASSSSSGSNSSSTSSAEMTKKSNSTGFSKLWRLKEKVGRSNSDGRDAFVFLKHNDKPAATMTPKVTSSDHGIYVKVNDARGKPRVVKAKKASVSAHEAYMKSRGGHTEDDRRKSYLPYRPELMGFFTNVHSGLSKNVHPY